MLAHASWTNDDGAMRVFLAQAVIIFVEDHVIALGKWAGFRDSRFWHVVGFVWTVGVLGASMESWTGRMLEHGLWVHEREVDLFGLGPQV